MAFVDGKFDEFAIWSRALSPSEVVEVHHYGTTTGLLAQTATAAFTPDIAGTYTVQLTVADGVSVTADAVIAAAGGGGRRRRRKGRARGRGFSVAETNSSLGAGFNSAFD
jgi:thioredoxin reductase